MAITPFATLDDYEARYGDPSEPEQVTTLLSDATAFIMGTPGFSQLASDDAGYELQQANLNRVCCAVVHRALSAGQWAGMSSVSQGADGYSASVSLANPTEDFYLTKQEKRTLGIFGAQVGTIGAAIHDGAGDVIWP